MATGAPFTAGLTAGLTAALASGIAVAFSRGLTRAFTSGSMRGAPRRSRWAFTLGVRLRGTASVARLDLDGGRHDRHQRHPTGEGGARQGCLSRPGPAHRGA